MTVWRLGLSTSQAREGTRNEKGRELGCYCLPLMRSGDGVFICRDKYSTHQVSSREKRGKMSKKKDLLAMNLHGDEDGV